MCLLRFEVPADLIVPFPVLIVDTDLTQVDYLVLDIAQVPDQKGNSHLTTARTSSRLFLCLCNRRLSQGKPRICGYPCETLADWAGSANQVNSDPPGCGPCSFYSNLAVPQTRSGPCLEQSRLVRHLLRYQGTLPDAEKP